MQDCGKVSIFEAAAKGDLKAVKCLIEVQHVSVDSSVPGSKETVLMKAAQKGNAELINYLLNQKAMVNTRDRNGYNALLWAVDSNIADINAIRYLLSKGADFSTKDRKFGYTAAHWAAYNGRVDILELLHETGDPLDKSSNISPSDAIQQYTPLTLAATRGSTQVVTFLLDHKIVSYNGDIFSAAAKGYYGIVAYFLNKDKTTPGSNKINDKDPDGETLLSLAVSNGNLKLVKYLIDEKQADEYVQYKSGDVLMHKVAKYGKLDIMKYLIDEKHMSWDVVNDESDNPLSCAVSAGHLKIVKYLVEERLADTKGRFKHNKMLLHIAARDGRLDIVKYLVEEKDAPLEVNEQWNYTPLGYAVYKGHLDIVKYLINKGANTDVKDIYGNGLTLISAQYGTLNVLKYLIDEKQMNLLDVKNINNDTLLSTAVANGHLHVVRYLIDVKKASMNGRYLWNKRILHHAAQYGALEIIEYFLDEKHLRLEDIDDYNYTPLAYAVYGGQLDTVIYLIDRGANVIIKSKPNGNGLLHIAAEYGKLDVVKYLVDKKLPNFTFDINAKNNLGNTPFHEAAKNGRLEIVQYFVEEKKMDVNLVNKNGETPLQSAQNAKKEAVVKYLTSKGGNRRRRQLLPSDYSKEGLGLSKSSPSSNLWLMNRQAIGPNDSSEHSSAVVLKKDDQQPSQLVNASGERFLALSDVIVRMLTGQKYKQPIHKSLLSKDDILQNEINSVGSEGVIKATRTGYM